MGLSQSFASRLGLTKVADGVDGETSNRQRDPSAAHRIPQFLITQRIVIMTEDTTHDNNHGVGVDDDNDDGSSSTLSVPARVFVRLRPLNVYEVHRRSRNVVDEAATTTTSVTVEDVTLDCDGVRLFCNQRMSGTWNCL